MRRLLNHFPSWAQSLRQGIHLILVLLLATQFAVAPASATSLYEIPPLAEDTWVVDIAEVISRSNEGKLSTMFADLAAKTGYEVRVVTVRRLDYEETAQGLTDKLFTRWFPEADEQANQVLLVLDSVTNNTGIRTGANVKAAMSDAIADSVAQESVLIPLKEGNKYNLAVVGASDRMVAVLSGDADPGPPTLKEDVMVEGTFATKEATKQSNATVWVIGFLIAATIIPMATYYFYQYMGSR